MKLSLKEKFSAFRIEEYLRPLGHLRRPWIRPRYTRPHRKILRPSLIDIDHFVLGSSTPTIRPLLVRGIDGVLSFGQLTRRFYPMCIDYVSIGTPVVPFMVPWKDLRLLSYGEFALPLQPRAVTPEGRIRCLACSDTYPHVCRSLQSKTGHLFWR